MGFWSYIGLASKKDIDNINNKMNYIDKIINISIENTNKIINKNNELEKIIQISFNDINNRINIINSELESITQLIASNISSEERNNEILRKNNKQLQKKIVDLNNSLKPIYSEIIECKKNNEEKFIANSIVFKDIIKQIKENKISVSKDLSIIQEMIKTVWINDIVDAVEKKVENKK